MIHENIQDLHVFWCPIKSHHISLVVIKPVLIPFYMNPIKIIVQYQNFGLLIPLYMNPIIYIYIPLQYCTWRFPKMGAPPNHPTLEDLVLKPMVYVIPHSKKPPIICIYIYI